MPGLRLWFAIYLAWMGGLAALALSMFARYEAGDPEAVRIWLLALMGFYLSLCNVFLPLPTSWIILFAASPEVGSAANPWSQIIAVAVLGGLSTTIANLMEYHLLAFLLHYGLGRRVRGTRVYQWAIRWFDVAPFQTLLLVGFVPIPIDAIRWLAVLRRYPRARFALAYLLSRSARYTLLAWLSVRLELAPWHIVAIQGGIVAVAVAGRLLWRGQRPGAAIGAGELAPGGSGPPAAIGRAAPPTRGGPPRPDA